MYSATREKLRSLAITIYIDQRARAAYTLRRFSNPGVLVVSEKYNYVGLEGGGAGA